MAFAFVINSEPIQDNKRDEDIDQFDSSKEESEDKHDIYVAFNELFDLWGNLRSIIVN